MLEHEKHRVLVNNVKVNIPYTYNVLTLWSNGWTAARNNMETDLDERYVYGRHLKDRPNLVQNAFRQLGFAWENGKLVCNEYLIQTAAKDNKLPQSGSNVKPVPAATCKWAKPVAANSVKQATFSELVSKKNLVFENEFVQQKHEENMAALRAQIVRLTNNWPFCTFANRNVELIRNGRLQWAFHCSHCSQTNNVKG